MTPQEYRSKLRGTLQRGPLRGDQFCPEEDRISSIDTAGPGSACRCMVAADRQIRGTCRGSGTFFEWPVYRFSLPRPIIAPRGYTGNPRTIGDHIRKRRIDLGLFQRQAAEKIGVSEASVYNWERGIEPELRHMPKVIRFLGYVPFPCPEDLIGRLKHFKLVNGLSYERLGAAMGRDPEQLTDWMSGRMRPSRKNLEKIRNFLQGRLDKAQPEIVLPSR